MPISAKCDLYSYEMLFIQLSWRCPRSWEDSSIINTFSSKQCGRSLFASEWWHLACKMISCDACLTLMLVVVYFYLANITLCKKPRKRLKPWNMCTHLRTLIDSYPMNTNMIDYRGFSKTVASLRFRQK